LRGAKRRDTGSIARLCNEAGDQNSRQKTQGLVSIAMSLPTKSTFMNRYFLGTHITVQGWHFFRHCEERGDEAIHFRGDYG
jgi:hypothetical protein